MRSRALHHARGSQSEDGRARVIGQDAGISCRQARAELGSVEQGSDNDRRANGPYDLGYAVYAACTQGCVSSTFSAFGAAETKDFACYQYLGKFNSVPGHHISKQLAESVDFLQAALSPHSENASKTVAVG